MEIDFYENCSTQKAEEPISSDCNCGANHEFAGNLNDSVISNFEKEIIEDVGENVFNYLKNILQIRNQKTIYLSHKRHYFYSSEDLTDKDVIINFQVINNTYELENSLARINPLLLPKRYYIGCYKKYWTKSNKQLIKRSRYLGRHFFLSKGPLPLEACWSNIKKKLGKFITPKRITSIFYRHGFTMIDLYHMDGIVYFIIMKTSKNQNELIIPIENSHEKNPMAIEL